MERSAVDSEKNDANRESAGLRAESEPRRTIEDISAGDTIQDFRLFLELGRGAFAKVFLAQQISMQRIVALKISDQASVESPLLSNLDHPNIVRVYDERRVDGLSLLYMQYIPGKSLRQVIYAAHSNQDTSWSGSRYINHVAETLLARGETPLQSESSIAQLSWGETVAWLGARLAHALEHAHNKRFWHRDIKPENILIAADGRPMLADFNLSFGDGIDMTHRREEFGGSCAYMSPEHIEVLLNDAASDAVNASSDVYSLAIVLWELLTGCRPFPDSLGLDESAMRELLHSRSRIPLLSDFYECPKGLHEAILQCLSPRKVDRPTAKQLTRSLQYCTFAEVHRLLHPDADSPIAKWQARPIAWLIVLGLVPNTLVAVLNIWANHRLTIKNFDSTFFQNTEAPIVNLIAFPLGVLVSLWIIWPIASGLKTLRVARGISDVERERVAMRCLSAPYLSAGNILFLFAVSGLVFPLWNQWSPLSKVTLQDVFGFFLSQVLHGLVAAGSTFVITAFVTLRAFYPKFISPDESATEQRELDRFEKRFLVITNIMAMIPLLAILALVVADQLDKGVFVALAIAGFASHLLSSYLTPLIRSGVGSLRFALAPTITLLQRDSTHRHP